MALGQLPRGKLPPTPKLTLTQSLTPSWGNFPLVQLSGCSPTLKLTLILTQIPKLTRGNFPLGVIVRIPKGTPKIKVYRLFKKFNIENFNSIRKNKLEYHSNHYSEFEKLFLNELNRHTPLKNKKLRHDNITLMTKELREEIMLRSKLKNKFNKERIHICWINFRHQRNRWLN